jgi:hypothetical protein
MPGTGLVSPCSCIATEAVAAEYEPSEVRVRFLKPAHCVRDAMSQHVVATEGGLDERLKRFKQNMLFLNSQAKIEVQADDEEKPLLKVPDHHVTFSNPAAEISIEQQRIVFVGLEDLGRNKRERLQEVGELKMRKLFNSFDTDGGGTISEIEFVRACKNLRLNFDEEQLKLFFQEFDEDQNKSLDFAEFTALIKTLRSKHH